MAAPTTMPPMIPLAAEIGADDARRRPRREILIEDGMTKPRLRPTET